MYGVYFCAGDITQSYQCGLVKDRSMVAKPMTDKTGDDARIDIGHKNKVDRSSAHRRLGAARYMWIPTASYREAA